VPTLFPPANISNHRFACYAVVATRTIFRNTAASAVDELGIRHNDLAVATWPKIVVGLVKS